MKSRKNETFPSTRIAKKQSCKTATTHNKMIRLSVLASLISAISALPVGIDSSFSTATATSSSEDLFPTDVGYYGVTATNVAPFMLKQILLLSLLVPPLPLILYPNQLKLQFKPKITEKVIKTSFNF